MENIYLDSQIPNQPTMPAQHKNQMLKIISAAFLVLILIGGGVWYWLSHRNKIEQAPAGQVVSSFPKELIGEQGAYITQSYSRANDSTVSYVSNKNLKDNISAYKLLLMSNGWQIYGVPDLAKTVTGFYAKKGQAELNITFDARDPKAIKVTEAYSTDVK